VNIATRPELSKFQKVLFSKPVTRRNILERIELESKELGTSEPLHVEGITVSCGTMHGL